MRSLTVTLIMLASVSCAAPAMDAQPDSSDDTGGRADLSMQQVRASIQQTLSRAPTNLRMRKAVDGSDYVEVVSGFHHAAMLVVGDAGNTSHCLTDEREALRLLERAPE